MSGFLKNIQSDARATLSAAEKKVFVDLFEKINKPPPLPDLSKLQLVKEWKLEDLETGLNFEASTRDRANGRKVFARALCDRCHRRGLEGGVAGPDLTHVSRRFSRRDLLAEILDPSRSIAVNYQASVLEMKDGRVLSGQVIPNLDYRAPHLQLATDPLRPERFTRITKASIRATRRSPVSVMPAGLLNIFSRKEKLRVSCLEPVLHRSQLFPQQRLPRRAIRGFFFNWCTRKLKKIFSVWFLILQLNLQNTTHRRTAQR